METLDHLICAHDENYLEKKDLTIFNTRVLNCQKILNGYIAYLVKAKKAMD